VDNGINGPRTRGNIRVDGTSTTGTTIDSDVVFLRTTSGQTMIIWKGVSYPTLAAMQAASGQEGRGISADPLWAAPQAADFRLTAGSPAIDSADSGVSGAPATDATGAPRVDDPYTPNTGVGPRSYDDRGALEYAPPPPVPDLAATVGPASVDLAWSRPGDPLPAATAYTVWRSVSPDPAAALVVLPGTAGGYSDSAGVAGTTYCYAVSAANAAGSSPASAPTCVPFPDAGTSQGVTP
jgi:hypothetical protein